MSKNSTQHAEKIKQLKNSVFELYKQAETNYYRVLMKRWVVCIGVAVGAMILGIVLSNVTPIQQIQPLDEAAVKSM